jgi:MFS family permease
MLPTWLLPADLSANFHRLLGASALTNAGDGILLAAGPLLIASLTDSPAAVGAAVFVQQLPWLLFGMASGTVVDRVDPRLLVAVVNVCRATTMAVLAGFVLADAANTVLVYAALFVLGTGETLADSAASPLLVSSVPPDRLGMANARLGLTFTAGNQLIGPPLGALLFAAGRSVPLFTQALAFAAGAVLIARMNVPAVAQESTDRASMFRDLKSGLRWLAGHPAMRALAVSILLMNVTFTAAFATWVLYCTQLLRLTHLEFGLLTTCAAMGGLAGPWMFGRVQPLLGYAGIVRLGFVIEGAVHLLLATVPPAPVVAATMVSFGVHTMVWGAAANTLRQRVTPEPLLGRVTSVYFVASIGGSAIGAAIGSVLAQQLGLTAAFWMAGTLMLLVAVTTWPAIRALRLPTEAETR